MLCVALLLQDTAVSDRWKEGMPDVLYDMLKATRRFGRNKVKTKCYWVYAAIRCYCFRYANDCSPVAWWSSCVATGSSRLYTNGFVVRVLRCGIGRI